MITPKSTVGDILKHPIGKDLIDRLLMYSGKKPGTVDNFFVRHLSLKTLSTLAPALVTPALVSALVKLFNDCDETLAPGENPKAWWKESVVYQIYPRSFCDSNGDGVGDIRGIIGKADYIKSLGVDMVWLSPVYDSPNDDNGYDIRDYRKILPEFGTMDDFDELVYELHLRGVKLVMDMVLNHTSDEHPWFISSKNDPKGKYGDYYIWRKSQGAPPNNWTSIFSGDAWTYYPERDEWALHLFSKKQMDLNWENPAVRDDICEVLNFWLDKGVDGFRLDVINFISKSSLEDGCETLGSMLGVYGMEHYFYGKRLHEYLRELNERVFSKRAVFTVGETPGTGFEMNKLLCAPSRRELNMVFSFDHLDNPGKRRFDDYAYDPAHLKKCLSAYQQDYAEVAWPSIFLENHDNPRMVSKIDPALAHRAEVAKLLALIELTSKGTPFIYQGQELGAVNACFEDISEMRDVESINKFAYFKANGEADPFKRVLHGARDHARTPMQWDGGPNAGFTSGQPWIKLSPGYLKWNAAAQEKEDGSVLNFYKKLIELRRKRPALVYGKFIPVAEKDPNVFCYLRGDGEDCCYVEANLTAGEYPRPRPVKGMEPLASNYGDIAPRLRAYEANVYSV